jgi:protein-S-isoprenylcysteine O-methyltransferase Ste14
MEFDVNVFRGTGYFLSTLTIYLGVTLSGWGLGDMKGYFSDSHRLGYALVAGLFSLLIGIQAYFDPVGIDGSKGEESKYIFRQRIVAIILEISMLVALFFIPFLSRREMGTLNTPGLISFVGVVFSALGYGLIFYSGVTLGRQYSGDVTIQKNHQLITSGLYRLVRHPRYLGIVAIAVGIPLVFRSWIGLVASLFFTGLILFRIKDEEVAMHKEFGPQWEEYCQRSWRLIPRLY